VDFGSVIRAILAVSKQTQGIFKFERTLFQHNKMDGEKLESQYPQTTTKQSCKAKGIMFFVLLTVVSPNRRWGKDSQCDHEDKFFESFNFVCLY
jgi:hypothetical protein